MSLSADADIPAGTDLFGKTVSDLQSNIALGNNAITGTLKYVADYSSAFPSGEESGNFIALHFAVADEVDATITVEVVGGLHGPSTLDDDGIIICRITDKDTQKIKVVATAEGYSTTTKVYDLSGLTLLDS